MRPRTQSCAEAHSARLVPGLAVVLGHGGALGRLAHERPHRRLLHVVRRRLVVVLLGFLLFVGCSGRLGGRLRVVRGRLVVVVLLRRQGFGGVRELGPAVLEGRVARGVGGGVGRGGRAEGVRGGVGGGEAVRRIAQVQGRGRVGASEVGLAAAVEDDGGVDEEPDERQPVDGAEKVRGLGGFV